MLSDNSTMRKSENFIFAHTQNQKSYPIAEDFLHKQREKLKASGISLFLEESDICKTVLNDEQFLRVLQYALKMMEEEVNRVDVTGRKYIQMKSMYMQQRLFLKFTYSSERDQPKEIPCYEGISGILARAAGYIHVENQEYENILMIAVPVK